MKIRDINPHLGHKDDVIPQYLPMVHRICNRYKKLAKELGIDYEDIYSVGCIGLVKAYDSYDPTQGKNAKFLSYAMVYVDGYLKSYAFDNGLIRIPRKTLTLSRKIKQNWLENESPEVIAEALGCRVSTAELAKQALGNVTLSMETPLRTKRSDNLTIADVINEADDHTGLEVKEFLDSLTDNEKKIVIRLLTGHTKRAISKEIGRSETTLKKYTKQIAEKLQAHIG